MPWTVEVTDAFEAWWDRLNDDERVSIDGMIRALEAHDTFAAPPYSRKVAGPHRTDLRELRVPHNDWHICVLYVSELSRGTVVLVTGTTSTTEEEVCPADVVALAEAIYNRHVELRGRAH